MFKRAIIESGVFMEGRIGGEGNIIEVDETHIYFFKNNQCRILRGQKYWIVGLISRSTKEIRLLVTRHRNKRVLNGFIRRHVNRGFIIFSDCWKGYRGLEEMGFVHETVNHKQEFVSAECPIVHTNTIELLWGTLNEKIKKPLKFQDIVKSVEEFKTLYNSKALSIQDKYDYVLESLKNFNFLLLK